jgi:hypothetical protein
MTHTKTLTIFLTEPAQKHTKKQTEDRSPWLDQLLHRIRIQIDSMVKGDRVVVIRGEDDCEPLIEEKRMAYTPTHAASDFLRNATSRSLRRYNEIL